MRLPRRTGQPAARRSGRAAVETLATPASIEAVLDEVDAHAGGMHGLLAAHGRPAADLNRRRAAFAAPRLC